MSASGMGTRREGGRTPRSAISTSRAQIAAGGLRPFQRRFLAEVGRHDTSCLSIPRANGKSFLGGLLVARFLQTKCGEEAVLFSGSIEQSRIVYRTARDILEPEGGYTFTDSANRVSIVHKRSNTRLRAHGSNPKTAFGLSGVPLIIWDEPGVADVVGGNELWDAIATAQGKPGSALRAVLIGTVSPATGGWWPDMIARGSHGSTYVQALQGDRATWDSWQTIRRANPLTEIDAGFRKKLIEERDAAREDSRLRARFLSYRLNLPTADESETLLTVDDVEQWIARPVPERVGPPIVALDIGGSRAWSAAVATWENGRVEAYALAPGKPDIAAQEKRDRVPVGTYEQLAASGVLGVAAGLEVPPVGALWAGVLERWGAPVKVIADRFRLPELRDVGLGCPVEARVTRWSEATSDIAALRRLVKDGPLSLEAGSRLMLVASLKSALVKNDDAGSSRLIKKGTHNSARDDVAAALTLAAGAYARASARNTGLDAAPLVLGVA